MSPDKQILERAQAGDSTAFAEVVDACYDTIFRFAMRYTGHRQDAEDVAQQACIKLAKSIASYRFESSFSTWLYALVLNCARDWHRYQSRHRQDYGHNGPAGESTDLSSEVGVEAEAGYDSDCGADSVNESRIFLSQVLARVDDMGNGYRDVLVLVAGEGMSHREAAELLGVKESTVSWRLHEIRKRLDSAAMREDYHE